MTRSGPSFTSSSSSIGSGSGSGSGRGSLVQSAMDILQEQDLYNIPIDAALRRNARQMKEVGMSKPQQKALREFLLYVARRQGHLDWRLRQAKLDTAPENRVVLALA
jgi:hypothetical protein